MAAHDVYVKSYVVHIPHDDLSPDDARKIAKKLVDAADEAEKSFPPGTVLRDQDNNIFVVDNVTTFNDNGTKDYRIWSVSENTYPSYATRDYWERNYSKRFTPVKRSMGGLLRIGQGE